MASFWATWPTAAQIIFLLATCFATIGVAVLLKVAYSRWLHRRYRTCDALDAPTAYKPTDEIPQAHDLEANAVPLPNVKSVYHVKTLPKAEHDPMPGRTAAVPPSRSGSHESIPPSTRRTNRSSTGSDYKIAYIMGKDVAQTISPSRSRYNSVYTNDAPTETPPKDPSCQPTAAGQYRVFSPQPVGKQSRRVRVGKDSCKGQDVARDPWSLGRLLSFERLTQPSEAQGKVPRLWRLQLRRIQNPSEDRSVSKKLKKRPKVQFRRRSSESRAPSIESEKDCVWLADDAGSQPGRLQQRVAPAFALTNKESFNTVDLGMPEALTSMYPRRDNRSSSDNTVKAQKIIRVTNTEEASRWVAPWQIYQGLPPTPPRLPSDHGRDKSAFGTSRTSNVMQKPKTFDGISKQPTCRPRESSPASIPRFYAKPTTSPGPQLDIELDSLPRHESKLHRHEHEHEHDHALAIPPLVHHEHAILDDDGRRLLTDTYAKAEEAPAKDCKGPASGTSEETRSRPSRWLGLGPRTLRKVKRDAALRKSFASAGSSSSRWDID